MWRVAVSALLLKKDVTGLILDTFCCKATMKYLVLQPHRYFSSSFPFSTDIYTIPPKLDHTTRTCNTRLRKFAFSFL